MIQCTGVLWSSQTADVELRSDESSMHITAGLFWLDMRLSNSWNCLSPKQLCLRVVFKNHCLPNIIKLCVIKSNNDIVVASGILRVLTPLLSTGTGWPVLTNNANWIKREGVYGVFGEGLGLSPRPRAFLRGVWLFSLFLCGCVASSHCSKTRTLVWLGGRKKTLNYP